MGGGKKSKYISFRVAVLMAAGGLGAAVTLCGAVLSLWLGGQAFLPLVLGVILLALWLVVTWFWVVQPYRQLEQEERHFLESYRSDGGDLHLSYMLSPVSQQLLEQNREVLNPSNMFHLNKRQAQYQVLQNQINPHFLYNTLESIRSEALMAQLDSVADMTEALATFFRYTISKVENLVSVEEELQNCEAYFQIQRYRFGDRLSLEVVCDPEEREEMFRCRLPKLTMQPILENSIIHGTEEKLGAGHLSIHLERTEKNLLIRISDDGVGMDEATLARINAKLGHPNPSRLQVTEEAARGGLALVNVNNRIRLLFGEEYGLHVFSMVRMGTDVEITLPAITSDRDVKNWEALG